MRIMLAIFLSLFINTSFSSEVNEKYIENKFHTKENLKKIEEHVSENFKIDKNVIDLVSATDYDNIITLKLNPMLINSDILYFNYFIKENLISTGEVLKNDDFSMSSINEKIIKKSNLENLKIYLENSKTIDYISSNEETVVYIFTDPTCPYCNKLHDEIPKLNDAGVTIKYVPYSRSFRFAENEVDNGISYKQLAISFCAGEKQQSVLKSYFESNMKKEYFNHEFLNINESDYEKCKKIVENGYIFGKYIGLSGTPAILLSNGDFLSGYYPSEKFIDTLKKSGLIKDKK